MTEWHGTSEGAQHRSAPLEESLEPSSGALPARSVLVVDDDPLTRMLVKKSLECADFDVHLCESGEQALQCLKAGTYSVLVSDIRMWGMDGLALVVELKRQHIPTVPILLTGFGSLEGAVEAIRSGAFDYISKPFQPQELIRTAERAFGHYQAILKEAKSGSAKRTHVQMGKEIGAERFIGRSPAIVSVYRTLARAALTSSTVLITGESGTGKELVARAIHRNSPRGKSPFVAVNCGALSETLLESELFGHVRGAFTGASGDKKGVFEEASGGTIFLDEIGDISPALQVKLLRVLQYGEIKPVGSPETRTLDTRVIAATHCNLFERVKEGKFREDLFYRLNVLSIEIPPLRDRVMDIRDLAEHFLEVYAQKNEKPDLRFSEECFPVLEKYNWPGNVRELEHCIEFAVAMSQGSTLFPENFPQSICDSVVKEPGQLVAAQTSPPTPEVDPESQHAQIRDTLAQNERAHILSVLASENFNRTRTARRLGIDRATLYRKMWKYSILN